MTPSTFAWLDYSDSDRKSMLEAIREFREKDTVDEIGIGSIRDGFSNLLFPGTSVLHTRARYLLFIPWIYLELEQRSVSSTDIAARARRDEVKLIDALKRGVGDRHELGIIGLNVGARIQALPSRVYWSGLLVDGLRLFPGSIEQYHRSLDLFYAMRREALRTDDGDSVSNAPPNWHPSIPAPPPELLSEATFDLTGAEARYLRDRIQESHEGTLLAFLVGDPEMAPDASYPWLLPDLAALPSDARRKLDAARNFSQLIQGARLLYNVAVAEIDEHEALELHRERLEAWELRDRGAARAFAHLDRDAFWTIAREGNPRIPQGAVRFVERWAQIVADLQPVSQNPDAVPLLREREQRLKGGLARLNPHNLRAREIWAGTAGTLPLDYRWSASVRALVRDIHAGLRRDLDAVA